MKHLISTIQFLSTYLQRVFEMFLPVVITLFVYYQIERTESDKAAPNDSPKLPKMKQPIKPVS
jgi:hypothetical protein